MNSHRLILWILICLLSSCTEQEARRPVSKSKSYTLADTSEQMKKINQIEEAKIRAYIQQDTLSSYISSPDGFLFQYITKAADEGRKPKSEEIVTLEYEILDLENQAIYTKEELGLKEYKIDKEDFIPALQRGIKLMKEGETVKFVIPSYNAFGLVGDGSRIGINKSIISIVTLVNIKQTE